MYKKKLLFIVPSLIGGGAERILINLLQNYDYKNYEITVVVVLGKGIYLKSIPLNVKLVILFKTELVLKTLTKIHQKINFIFPLKWVLKRKIIENYDVGICAIDGPFTELLHTDGLFKRKFTWVHASYKSYSNYYRYYKNNKYRNRLLKSRYREIDSIIFVSNNARDEFIELFGEHKSMHVIYNPINKKAIVEKSLELVEYSEFKGTFNFVTLGSLIPVKNYDLLIDAASLLKEKNEKFKIFILGDGLLRKSLVEKVTSLELSNNIIFKGFIKNPYPYIKNSDVFVMTSISEALPTALCEAMILSKPVIVTNVSGCKEVVNNGEYGMVSELNSINLYERMLDIINDRKKYEYYSRQSKKRAEIFNDEEFFEKFNELILG